ncbi:hypothetical protein TBS_08630 [Thermobispora bispora]|jgi:hydrogenase maturation protease|uniref:hydrogenase maturation protease n=1 Tax=Thermobispora bispora TaxID=2006 RepID=UPI0023531D30|nr:hydrogenase maturation protease [Actinomycetales bacterium]MBX6166602.1 hydrogenase maturation protease [Thermobispora bispora]MDI9581612.1 hydrogenase maturation protease [Thermobispora sp.]
MSTSGERAAPGRTVVIGLGNDWRGDDRAGLETVRVLREELPAGGAPGVAIVEGGGDLTELIDVWAGADLAVVIDAVRTGAAPGTVHRWAGTAAAPGWRCSSHALGLADALGLGRALGRMPGELLLIGIEGERFAIGAAMSPAVRAAAARTARDLARTLCGPGRTPAGERSR